MKDNIIWGDNYHDPTSYREERLPFHDLFTSKTCSWFELNYFHGWLVSNVLDSTYHYLENETTIHYHPANKYMAANLFTFTP